MIFKKPHLRMRFYILPFVFLMITLYFTYHLIQGERGLFRLFEVNKELDEAETLLKKSEHDKAAMESKIDSLSAESLSADMLDELGRKELGFIKSNEYVIFE